jgi:hypothetical protein
MKSHFTRIVAQVFTVGLMASLISCGSTQVTLLLPAKAFSQLKHQTLIQL